MVDHESTSSTNIGQSASPWRRSGAKRRVFSRAWSSRDFCRSSELGLSKARDLAEKRGVSIQTVQADLEHYEITPESQHLIVSIYCHLPDAIRKLVHSRAAKALKPGCLFILEAFHHSQLKYQSGGPKTTDLLYDLDALIGDFQALQILEAFDGLGYLDEGVRHTGLGHIVRLVLQKPQQ